MIERIAAAPISWGVCEVPGWGVQLPPDRVLDEMRTLGVAATEAGPDGFLPSSPPEAAALVEAYGLRLVGGFVPAVLHSPGGLDTVERAAALFAAAGADVLLVCAIGARNGYDARPELHDAEWERLLTSLDAARELCAAHGLTCALHPHVGTVVERREEVERVLDGSDVGLCLDTGHLLAAGADPVSVAAEAGERITHVHLKDVDGELLARLLGGRVQYSAAVRAGLYRPLGEGAVDVAGLVELLTGRGYDGWFVLEQDVMLDAVPAAGEGPARDIATSLENLRAALAVGAASTRTPSKGPA